MFAYYSLAFFAIAAALGLILVRKRLREEELPLFAALTHGIFAAAGLITLCVGWLSDSLTKSGAISLFLFIVAALGGFYLASVHFRNRKLPIPVMFIHALVAVTAFVVLAVGTIGL